MSDCDPFTIRLEGNIEDLMTKVKEIAVNNDIDIRGDHERGSFDMDIVKGNYSIEEEEISIKVSDRPILADCKHLQELLSNLFKGNDSKDYRKIIGYMKLKRL